MCGGRAGLGGLGVRAAPGAADAHSQHLLNSVDHREQIPRVLAEHAESSVVSPETKWNRPLALRGPRDGGTPGTGADLLVRLTEAEEHDHVLL